MFYPSEQRKQFIVEEVDSWNDEQKAKYLQLALKGKRAESTINDILGQLDECRRRRLIKAYKEYTSRKLSHDIMAELAGDFEFICQCVIVDPVTFLVKMLQNELNEFPTPQHQYICFFLCERNKEETRTLVETYQKRFLPLKKALDDNLTPECSKLVQLILNPFRQQDLMSPMQVHRDAQDLIQLGIGIQYGDESEPIVYTLIRQRSYGHLRAVFAEYKRLTGRGLASCLEQTMPECQRQWLTTLIDALLSPELYCAKTLVSASKSPQTFLKCLLTLRLTRTIPFFRRAVQLVHEIQGEKIQDAVKREFDGLPPFPYKGLNLSA